MRAVCWRDGLFARVAATGPHPLPLSQRERGGSSLLSRREKGGFSRLSRRQRAGFSLLEVILALTILAGAVAVLGEVARHGLETARIARDLTYAELLCESKMAEITSGMTTPDPVDRAAADAVSNTTGFNWVYSIETESTEIEGLLAVRVTVEPDQPDEKHPIRCSIVRWIQDPDATSSSSSSSSTE